MLKTFFKTIVRKSFLSFDKYFIEKRYDPYILETSNFTLIALPKIDKTKPSKIASIDIDFKDEIFREFLPIYKELLKFIPENDKIKILDIGSRGDFQADKFNAINEHVEFYCFEIEDEGNIKNQENVHFYNHIVSGIDGLRTFTIKKNPFACSISEFKLEYYSRLKAFNYPNNGSTVEGLEVLKEVQLQSLTIDSWAQKNNISDIDFIKVDVEGEELEVLKTSKKLLDNCLGTLIEVDFTDRVKVNNDFAETHALMKTYSLFLNDFPNPIRLGKISSKVNITSISNENEYSHGQIIGGNALYLADPLHHNNSKKIDDKKIIKLIAIAAVNGLFEYSFELIKYLKERTNDKNIQEKIMQLEYEYKF